MKLSRNRIQKIRKQQHQSVRKWKKHHKSVRRSTFRKSRRQNMSGIMTKYSSNVNNIVNRTLKKYVPLSDLEKIKKNYKKMRRMRRKHNMYKMTGGAGEVVQEPAVATTTNVNKEPDINISNIIASAVTAAVTASISAVMANNNANQDKAKVANTQQQNGPATSAAPELNTEPDTNTPQEAQTPSTTSSSMKPDATKKTSKNDKSKKPVSLGPAVIGDVTIKTYEHVCANERQAYQLVEFLIRKGLPYYIQIDIDPVNKPRLNKNDTDLFDLRRILYGKFVKDIKKIPESKRSLYFQENAVVGIADGDTLGNEFPDSLFIYTGEKGQIQKPSSDTEIGIKIFKKSSTTTPVDVLLNSNRMYKLGGKDKAASIDTIDLFRKLDRNNQINTSEFRLQVAPLTEDEFNKDAENVAAGNEQVKTVIDESNTYVVNLKEGCKITAVQTLRKSLERARLSLESEKDSTKENALDVFKTLNEVLENPEFAKTDGFDDFKETVFGFSYKIRGSERLYGFAQLKTFFENNKDISSNIRKEYNKLIKLLGHGPNGTYGECEVFNNVSRSSYDIKRNRTYEENGKVVTKIVETDDNASNISGFGKQLSKLGKTAKADTPETSGTTDNGDSNNVASTPSENVNDKDTTQLPNMAASTAASVASATAAVVASQLEKDKQTQPVRVI